MAGFMIRGWDPIVSRWRWLYFRAPANHRLAGGVGVSAPCGAVSTRRITIFVPGLSELYMYGRISEPVTGTYPPPPYPPRVALALRTPGWGFHTVQGSTGPGGAPFSPPVCWSCTCMEGFLIQGWGVILPGGRWLYEPQVGVYRPGRQRRLLRDEIGATHPHF